MLPLLLLITAARHGAAAQIHGPRLSRGALLPEAVAARRGQGCLRRTRDGERPRGQAGARVKSGDVVTLDGRKQDWEAFAASLTVMTDASSFITSRRWSHLHHGRSTTGGLCAIQPALKRYFSAGRVFPVGRLDADSEGLVLLTDDGKCADALLQPKSKVAKTYVVEFERDVDDGDVTRLADGVEIETPQQRSGATTTQKTRPCEVSREGDRRLRFILSEGRNRQLRRMAEAVGHAVVRLERVAFALDWPTGLERGAARELTASERADSRRARRRGGFFFVAARARPRRRGRRSRRRELFRGWVRVP